MQVLFPFSTFIGYCKQRIQNTDCGHGVCSELEGNGLTGPDAEDAEDAPEQIYLAQVPTSWAFV